MKPPDLRSLLSRAITPHRRRRPGVASVGLALARRRRSSNAQPPPFSKRAGPRSGQGTIPFLISRTIRAALLLLAAATTPAVPAAEGDTPGLAEIKRALDGPVQVLLDNGNRQKGEIVAWDGETLRLRVPLDAGSATMTFTAENIRDIAFPGANYFPTLAAWMRDPAHHDDALALFRAFYQQRGAFLRYMDAEERNLFLRYIRFALEQNKPLRAIAIIEVLRPHIENEARLKSLDEAILLGFFKANMRDRARRRARRWIADAGRAPDSALGWRVLAQIQFAAENHENAFWTALYPVAFSNQLPMEHLDACYAFAIASADALHMDAPRDRLTREMRERGIEWPAGIPALAAHKPEPPAAKQTPPTEAKPAQTKSGKPADTDTSAEANATSPDGDESAADESEEPPAATNGGSADTDDSPPADPEPALPSRVGF